MFNYLAAEITTTHDQWRTPTRMNRGGLAFQTGPG